MCLNSNTFVVTKATLLLLSFVSFMCRDQKQAKIMAKRSGNVTTEQKNLLIEYLRLNKQLVSSKFTADFTKKKAQSMWEEISTNLNSISGAQKTWIQWRKTWHDIKGKTKGKKADMSKSFTKTGGGPETSVAMSQIEDDVADLIGATVIHGDPTTNESVVNFDFSDNTTEQNQPSRSSQPSSESSPRYKLSNLKASKTRMSPTKRLQNKFNYTQSLASDMKTDLEIRENYYKKKLNLLERDVIAKERIARALEKLLPPDDSETLFENVEYLDENIE